MTNMRVYVLEAGQGYVEYQVIHSKDAKKTGMRFTAHGSMASCFDSPQKGDVFNVQVDFSSQLTGTLKSATKVRSADQQKTR